MKKRQYAKVIGTALILALLCAVTLVLATMPASAAVDITPVAATQITPENLASYADAGIGEAHIGFYAIESVGNLYWYASEVMGGNNTISAVLSCDLTVNEKVLETDGSLVSDTSALALWVPIYNHYYEGTLDGNGHVLRGLFTGNFHIADEYGSANAFFGSTGNVTIRNLGLEDSYFGADAQYNAASFVARAGLKSRIENCYSTATVVGTHYCGGIAGDTDGVIENCYFAGKLDCDESYLSGAIMSDYYMRGELNNCYYLEGCGHTSKRATAVTAEQLVNGMLAWSLNGGVSDGTQAFYQTVGVGHPTLSGATVYASTPCPSQFSNDAAAVGTVQHAVDSDNLLFDKNSHWVVCTQCGERHDEQPHGFNETGFCQGCGYQASLRIDRADGTTFFWDEDVTSLSTIILSGDYVRLLRDVSYTNQLDVPTSCTNVTVDINGYACDFSIEIHGGNIVTDSSEGMQGVMHQRIYRYYSGSPLILKNLRFSDREGGFKIYASSVDAPVVLDGVIFQTGDPLTDYYAPGVVIKSAQFTKGLNSDKVIAELLGEGAVVVDGAGNPITLTEGQTVLEGEFFIKTYAFSLTDASDTKYYENVETLSEALKSVSGEVTVTLLCDTNGERKYITAREGVDMVLDLAGKTLENAIIQAAVGGTLTLTDSSPEGTGVFIRVQGVNSIDAQGTVIIAGGTVDSGAVIRHENALLQITGGKAHDMELSQETGRVEITGGSFEYLYAPHCPEGTSVAITGGSFENISTLSITVGDLLAPGYMFYTADGFFLDLDATRIYERCEVVAHTHDFTQYGHDNTHHWSGCSCGMTEGGATPELHTGGSATCTAQAICTVCGNGYGELVAHVYGEDGACDACGETVSFIVQEKGGEMHYFQDSMTLQSFIEQADGGRIRVLSDVESLEFYFANNTAWTVELGDVCAQELNLVVYNGTVELLASGEDFDASVNSLEAKVMGGVLRVYGGQYEQISVLYLSEMSSSQIHLNDTKSTHIILQGAGVPIFVNGGSTQIVNILNVDLNSYKSDFSVLPVFMSFEITQGIMLQAYDIQPTLAQAFSLFGCIALQDGDGNPVTLPENQSEYMGHLVFVHTDSTDTERWHGDAVAHWHECLCGLRSDEQAHDFGDADSCVTCAGFKPIRVEGDGKTLYFTDLHEAIDVATEMTSAKITLLADADFGGEYEPREGDITLDLAGFELYIEELNLYGGSWRVIDSSEAQEGILLLDDESDIYEGLLILESGNFSIEVSIEDDTPGATLEIKGGTVLFANIWVKTGATLRVTSGEFQRMSAEMYGGRLVIEDGSFTDFSVAYIEEHTSFSITGGSFSSVSFHNATDMPLDLGIVFVTADCLRYLDEDGNDVVLAGQQSYYGGFTVEHDATHAEGGERAFDGDVHWMEYPCGQRDEIQAHYGGSASCSQQALCEACGTSYGAMALHNFGDDGICRDCGVERLLSVITPDGTFFFGDMDAAFAMAMSAERATVMLLDNVVLELDKDGNEHSLLLEAGDITLDLAGFTLTGAYFVITRNAILTVTDTSEAKSGKISSDYAFEVDGGTLIINGGEINASTVVNGSGVTVNGGVFTGNYGFDLYGKAAVTINGGIFKCLSEEFYYDAENFVLILAGGEFPEGLEIVDYNENPIAIIDLLAPFTCFSFVDDVGNPVILADGQYHYENAIRVLHTDSFTFAHNEEEHWEQCSCGKTKNKAAHSGGKPSCRNQAVCEICNTAYGALSEHTYDNACDGNCNLCLEDTRTPAAHVDANHDDKCDVCLMSLPHTHTHGTDWKTDANEHWNECACGDKANKGAHADANDDGKCDVCAYQMRANPPADTSNQQEDEGLSGGAIAGIAVGSAAAAGIGGFSVFWFVIKKKRFSDLIAVFKKR